jgi:hypothetical protein
MAEGKFVSYLRVSTARQGRSGLGLEAQRQAVEDFLNGGNWQLVKEFVEVESGKNEDRPQLAKAFQLCRHIGAKLVIAKLDRLPVMRISCLGWKRPALILWLPTCPRPTGSRSASWRLWLNMSVR